MLASRLPASRGPSPSCPGAQGTGRSGNDQPQETAIELARASPCDPRTLARAARDHIAKEPAFAVEAGCLALEAMARTPDPELTGADVHMAYTSALKAAEPLGRAPEIQDRIRALARSRRSFVTQVLGRELGLEP